MWAFAQVHSLCCRMTRSSNSSSLAIQQTLTKHVLIWDGALGGHSQFVAQDRPPQVFSSGARSACSPVKSARPASHRTPQRPNAYRRWFCQILHTCATLGFPRFAAVPACRMRVYPRCTGLTASSFKRAHMHSAVSGEGRTVPAQLALP